MKIRAPSAEMIVMSPAEFIGDVGVAVERDVCFHK